MKAWGAHVTSTCSSDAVDRVLELGADIALDYTKHNVMQELQRLHRYILVLSCSVALQLSMVEFLKIAAQ